MSRQYRGVDVAPGVGIGAIFVYHAPDGNIDAQLPAHTDDGADLPEKLAPPADADPVPPAQPDPDAEWQRFLDAQSVVEGELAAAGHALNSVAVDIFAVHQLILHDPTLVDAVQNEIRYNHADAATATYTAIRTIADLFSQLDDEYFSSRAADVRDVGRRLLTCLGANLPATPLAAVPDGSILVALDLRPSDVTQLADANVVGIALAASTPTAHSSILARSLGLPTICGVGSEILTLAQGTPAILDGSRGLLFVDPEEEESARYAGLVEELVRQRQLAYDHAHEPALSKDGLRVAVYANVNKPEDAEQVTHIGADGVGLLRTEYLFQNRDRPPSVAEQAAVYQRIGRNLGSRLLTVRALDAGGDKPVDFIPVTHEENPFLGKRGVRLLLAYPDLLAEQYRALLVAANALPESVNIRFMLPMISTLDEVLRAREIIADVDKAYVRQYGPHRTIRLGVLIEVPAAAVIARHLADLVDFFSIGTNDLAQYVMASDRTNSHVAQLADPLHPAVLQMIRLVSLAAMERELPVSLCGEMAGNVSAIPLLLGLGVNEFSAPLPAVPMVKQIIRGWTMHECRTLAEQALRCYSADRVRSLLDTEQHL